MKDRSIGIFLGTLREKIQQHAGKQDAAARILTAYIGVPVTTKDITFVGDTIKFRKVTPALRTSISLKKEAILEEFLRCKLPYRKIL